MNALAHAIQYKDIKMFLLMLIYDDYIIIPVTYIGRNIIKHTNVHDLDG